MYRREAYIKRTAVVRTEKMILVSLFLVALIISIMIISSKTYAGNFKSDNNSVKLFKSVTIYAGDTLESIAADYMTEEYSSVSSYIKEITSINGICEDHNLIPGNKLIVPYYTSKNMELMDPVIEISLAE